MTLISAGHFSIAATAAAAAANCCLGGGDAPIGGKSSAANRCGVIRRRPIGGGLVCGRSFWALQLECDEVAITKISGGQPRAFVRAMGAQILTLPLA